jgi:hypothetical protein
MRSRRAILQPFGMRPTAPSRSAASVSSGKSPRWSVAVPGPASPHDRGKRHPTTISVTDFSPFGVGPCFTLALSRHGGGPPPAMLTAHDQASQLVWVASTSTHHRPRSRFDTCSRVPASSGPMPLCARFSFSNRLVTTSSPCQARYGLGPRGVPMPLARARHGLLPAGGTNPSALSDSIFGAQHLQGRHHP